MQVNVTYLEDSEIYDRVVREGLMRAERTVWIATANVKDCQIEVNRAYRSIVRVFEGLCARGVDVRLLHGAVPSEAFLHDLRQSALTKEDLFTMRRCPRVHMKAFIMDGRQMYLGSANLTGAGVGAKGPDRRNFEVGLLTSHAFLIHQVARKFERIWGGQACDHCRRREVCAVPLEEPDL